VLRKKVFLEDNSKSYYSSICRSYDGKYLISFSSYCSDKSGLYNFIAKIDINGNLDTSFGDFGYIKFKKSGHYINHIFENNNDDIVVVTGGQVYRINGISTNSKYYNYYADYSLKIFLVTKDGYKVSAQPLRSLKGGGSYGCKLQMQDTY